MNAKTAKRIRKQIAATHGIDPTIENNGVTLINPYFRKLVQNVKQEYRTLPRPLRKQFKDTGI